MQNIKQILLEFIKLKRSWWSRLLMQEKYKDLNYIIINDDRFAKYPDFSFTLHTMCYWIVNDLYDFPVCANRNCNKRIMKNVIFKDGYNKHCCNSCAQSDPDIREKITNTNLKKYGAECPMQGKEQRIKAKQTCLQKYGVESSNKCEAVKQKQKMTCFKHYGVERPLQSCEVLKKQRQTTLERYGAEISWQSDDIKNKIKNTVNSRYGVDNVTQNEGIHKKSMQTCYSHHGVYFPMQSSEIKSQRIKTNLKKYGTANPCQNHEVQKRIRKRYTYNRISFDTKPEIALYIWLKDNNISFEYHPDISFQYFDGYVSRRYFPDFKVGDMLYEIKGDQFFKDDGTMQNPYDHAKDYIFEAKHQCMLSNNVKILRSANYRKYIDYVKKTYGARYLDQFKNGKKTNESERSDKNIELQ